MTCKLNNDVGYFKHVRICWYDSFSQKQNKEKSFFFDEIVERYTYFYLSTVFNKRKSERKTRQKSGDRSRMQKTKNRVTSNKSKNNYFLV